MEKDNEKVLKVMEPGVLFRPAKLNFVGVDMMWVQHNDSGQRDVFKLLLQIIIRRNSQCIGSCMPS